MLVYHWGVCYNIGMLEFTDISETLRVNITRELTEQQKAGLRTRLGELTEVEVVNLDGNEIRLQYFPHVISEQDLRDVLTEAGAVVSHPRKKNLLARFIDRLASENRANFGGGRMDCCDLPGKD